MPLTIKCSKCKHIIYHTDSLEGLEEIYRIFEAIGKCTSCGKVMKKEIEVKNVKVKPVVKELYLSKVT